MLAGKHLLLVLDNFEHVVDAASVVADLLARAPAVKVLTTSRTPLHAYGEREFPLPPFPMPDLAHLPSLEVLSQYDAVRLFVERAQAVRPDFAVTNANAPAVAEVCHRLDGLPLAIELAAAFVKVLPPQALLNKLQQRLPLLTGGARTLPARQQTMRNTIAWSHDFLTPEEQTLFRRLAVFPGGCTIEAAEAVASPDGTLDVFGGMTSLVDKSLLRQAEGVEGEPRFRMLETVREYGQERLEASGETEETRRRLAAWCVALVEQAEPDVFGGNISPEWVARLDDELPNVRATVNRLLECGEPTIALRLVVAAEDYWTQRQQNNAELQHWLDMALTAAPNAPVRDRALAHYILAIVNGTLGNDDVALRHAEHLQVAAHESGDPAALGLAYLASGFAWEAHGDLERAADAYGEAIPQMRASGMESGAWYAQAELADKLVLRGDLEAGVPMLDESLTRLRQRQSSSEWFVVIVIMQRGHAALRQGDLPGAARWFVESIELARNLQQPQSLLSAMAGLAGVALALNQAERAARLLGAVEAAQDVHGVGRINNAHHVERITADTSAALQEAAYERAWVAGHRMSLEDAVAEALAIADGLLTEAKGRSLREWTSC
jgi:predicted ATPase